MEWFLRFAGLGLADVRHLAFYEKPLAKFGRLLDTYARVGPAGWRSAGRALPLWARHRVSMAAEIRARLPGCDAPLLFAGHHASHAASAFYPSPHDRAAVLVMDAVGEDATSSVGVGRGSELEIFEVQRFPRELG